jgi:hypothetical protein
MTKDTSGFTYTKHANGVVVRSDGVVVSSNEGSSDNALYRAWLAAGNTPADEAMNTPQHPPRNRITKPSHSRR